MALLLGADGDEHRPVPERNGHTVVGVAALDEHAVRRAVTLGDLVGRGDEGRARAVGEQSGQAVVDGDVAGEVGIVGEVAQLRVAGVVVGVVTVRAGLQRGVEGDELVAVGDHDVASIAGVVQALEAGKLRLGDDLAGGGVEDAEAVLVGDDHARRDAGDLLELACRRPDVRAARRGSGGLGGGGGGGVGCGVTAGGEEQGREDCGHGECGGADSFLHARNINANDNRYQLLRREDCLPSRPNA